MQSINHKFIESISFIVLLFFSTLGNAQDIKPVPTKAEMTGIPLVSVPVDTNNAHSPQLEDYQWVTEKEVWYDPFDYSFQVITESTLISDVDINSMSQTFKDEKVYTLSSVDRPPVFTAGYLTAKDQMECTNDIIEELIQGKVNYPDKALAKEHDGKEVVMFTVNEYGEAQNYQVLSKDSPCAGCARAAVNAVSTLKDWYPAMKDGEPVKVKIAIPVRFLYVD